MTATDFFEITLNQTNVSQEVQTEIIKAVKNVWQHPVNFQNIQHLSPWNTHIITAQIHNTEINNDVSIDKEY